jgi:hypothetical protein
MGYTPYAGAAPGYTNRQANFDNVPQSRKRRLPKLYIPSSKWTWSFTAATIVQAIVGLAIEA